jgi:hypothetical protein
MESWSFSSETSDAPWRLLWCHVPTEPVRTARSHACRRSSLSASALLWVRYGSFASPPSCGARHERGCAKLPNMRRPLVLRQPGAWVCHAVPPPAAGTARGAQAGEAGARSSKGGGARPGPAAAALSLCQSIVPRALGVFVSLPGMFPGRWTAQGRVSDRRTCLPGPGRPGPHRATGRRYRVRPRPALLGSPAPASRSAPRRADWAQSVAPATRR